MEDQAKQALAQLLERAVSGVDAAVEFSQAQVPEVIEQLLMWHMAQSAIFMAVGLMMIVMPPFIAKNVINRLVRYEALDKDCGEDFAAWLFFWAIYTIPLAVGLIVTFVNLDWLQILIAPKLYLLEYAADLVK